MGTPESTNKQSELFNKDRHDVYAHRVWKPIAGLKSDPVQLSDGYSLRQRHEENLYSDESGSPKKLVVFELTRGGVTVSFHGQGHQVRIDGQDVPDDEAVNLLALFEKKSNECESLLKSKRVEGERDAVRDKLKRFYG